MSRAKDVWKYLGGLILAVVLLAWVFRDTDPAELWRQVRAASLPGLFACAFLNIGHNIFRVLRWRLLLMPVRRRVPLRPMLAAVMLGYMTSWVVPGRIGEIVRPMVLSSREPVPLGPCIGSVVADRLMDAVAVVVLFAVGMMVTPLSGAVEAHTDLIRSASGVLLAVTLVTLFVMVLASEGSLGMDRWFDRRGGVLRWGWRTFQSVAVGTRALRSPLLALGVLMHSLLAWTTIALGNWLGMRAAGADIPFGASLVILPMLVLGVALPTPAGAGGYHALMKQGLLLFGVSEVAAVSAGLLVHASFTLPMILIGVAVLWIEKVSWSELLGTARQFKDLGGAPKSPTTMERAT